MLVFFVPSSGPTFLPDILQECSKVDLIHLNPALGEIDTFVLCVCVNMRTRTTEPGVILLPTPVANCMISYVPCRWDKSSG